VLEHPEQEPKQQYGPWQELDSASAASKKLHPYLTTELEERADAEEEESNISV
jgi:hypothetical protein